jgi:hypothetical protein
MKPGSMFNTSHFAASRWPSSDGRRTTISFAINHPAAAAVHGRGRGSASRSPAASQQESLLCVAKTNAVASIANLSCKDHHIVCLPTCPPSLPKLVAACTGGRGLVPDVDCSSTATPCGTVYLDESSANCSDSIPSSISGKPLGGKGLVNSPHFSKNNDMMASLPTDNEVSKYSFYSCLSHYMEGHKIGKSICASVELGILSEAGAFVRDMDLMKKDKKEKAFLQSMSPSSLKLRMRNSRMS